MPRQEINLSKGQRLSSYQLNEIFNKARSTYDYANFNFPNGDYICVQFGHGGHIEISSNSRNLALWTQINSLKENHSQTRVVDFTNRWIQFMN